MSFSKVVHDRFAVRPPNSTVAEPAVTEPHAHLDRQGIFGQFFSELILYKYSVGGIHERGKPGGRCSRPTGGAEQTISGSTSMKTETWPKKLRQNLPHEEEFPQRT